MTTLDHGNSARSTYFYVQGGKELLCVTARLMCCFQILILDEATAAMDTETDLLIQETIREAFADCTMLTIAHRLHTVLGCDRIMVLMQGQVSRTTFVAAVPVAVWWCHVCMPNRRNNSWYCRAENPLCSFTSLVIIESNRISYCLTTTRSKRAKLLLCSKKVL